VWISSCYVFGRWQGSLRKWYFPSGFPEKRASQRKWVQALKDERKCMRRKKEAQKPPGWEQQEQKRPEDAPVILLP
jgi:hypothetical protein